MEYSERRCQASTLFTFKETCARLRISKRTLLGLLRDGELTYVNIGRGKERIRRMFAEQDILDFIENRRERRPLIGTPGVISALVAERKAQRRNRRQR